MHGVLANAQLVQPLVHFTKCCSHPVHPVATTYLHVVLMHVVPHRGALVQHFDQRLALVEDAVVLADLGRGGVLLRAWVHLQLRRDREGYALEEGRHVGHEPYPRAEVPAYLQ